MGQNFHTSLRSGPGGADPHSPYGQPDGRISVVSFTTPLKVRSKKRSLTFFEEAYFWRVSSPYHPPSGNSDVQSKELK